MDALDLRVAFDVLYEEFTVLKSEHDRLATRQYNAAEHERHRARMRAFLDALHDWHQTQDAHAVNVLNARDVE
jgi:hypothetical protein